MRLAAEKLYITQPSVSQAIKELEEYYGIRLFERLNQKIYLTEDGERLLSYARHLVRSFEEMEMSMKNCGKHPFLRIGSSVSVGTCLLSQWITSLEEDISGLECKVKIDNTSNIESMILKSELDVAVVEGGILSKDIEKIPVYKDEILLVVGRSHPWYSLQQISLKELENQNLICREEGSMERNLLDQYLKEQQIRVNYQWTSTNTEAIKKAVIDGHGLGVLSSLLVKQEQKDKIITAIPIKDVCLKRDINLIYHKQKYLSESLKAFIRICERKS